MWKEYIPEELIDAFMDRLFEKCNYSHYDMQRILADFAYSNKGIIAGQDAVEIAIEEACQDCMMVDELEGEVDKLEGELDDTKCCLKDVREDCVEIKNQLKTLKANSVIFTMDF